MNILGNPNQIPVCPNDLFTKKSIKYVSIFHNTKDCITKQPETEGKITMISGDTEAEKRFKGTSIIEVLQQMIEYCNRL